MALYSFSERIAETAAPAVAALVMFLICLIAAGAPASAKMGPEYFQPLKERIMADPDVDVPPRGNRIHLLRPPSLFRDPGHIGLFPAQGIHTQL